MADTFANHASLVDATRFREDIEHSWDTGSGAMAESLAPGCAFELIEIRITLSAASATSENFTIIINSAAGAAYDCNILTQDMDTLSDYVYGFGDERKYFAAGDELDFAWTNTNARTWGLEVIWRRLGS